MPEKTKVVFRVFKRDTKNRKVADGDVIALFPEQRWEGWCCSSYQHVGQHGGADYSYVVSVTRPATEAEIAPLKKELEGIGYELEVRKRSRGLRT